MLGNTPSVCRRCYIHPAILDGYIAGKTIATLEQTARQQLSGVLSKLRAEEAAVMMLESWKSRGRRTIPLRTKRWRWSWVAGPLSARGSNPNGRPSGSAGLRPRPWFCTTAAPWKSVDVSSAFESV